MSKKKFEVKIYYTGLENYIVEADSFLEAKEKARIRFINGEKGAQLGNEYENIEEVEAEEIQ